ncbi:MAG: type II toxin-antitoxin system Phd/YefM family antitoxin [Bryobacteraceae bacterium]
MPVSSKEFQTVSAFKRDSSGMLDRVKRSRRPLALTVKGQVKAVLVDPAVYERMADQMDAIENIRRGLGQAKKGLGRSADEVFDELEHALARG